MAQPSVWEVVASVCILVMWAASIPTLLAVAAAMFDDRRILSCVAAVSAAVIFIAGLSIAIMYGRSDRLCTRGHQQYQLVGKVMSKVWVCDQEEGQ